MALLAWVMMGIALWHFTVFLPDRFWAGIVGAFVCAVARRRSLFGLRHQRLQLPAPGRHDDRSPPSRRSRDADRPRGRVVHRRRGRSRRALTPASDRVASRA